MYRSSNLQLFYTNESTPSLLHVFRCNLDDDSDATYAYDVYWYINRNSVTFYKNIPYSNINTTVLRGSDWTHSYNMNMEVTRFQSMMSYLHVLVFKMYSLRQVICLS
jgi:hypothetical protein